MTAAITDFSQFTSLRADANRNDPQALKEVASQFEALFVQTLMKNMRGAELAEPIFGDNEQSRMYQDMLDKQLSLEMANGRGIGLADMIVRQMGGEVADVPVTDEVHMAPAMRREQLSQQPVNRQAVSRTAGGVAELPAWNGPDDFVRDVWPHAERAARKLGVAPEALLAQAALESGWGEHVMRDGGGASSNNLFGIKAGRDWDGGSVARSTLEYDNGVARRSVERFRAYPDLAASFDDYARLIGGESRYSDLPGKGDDVAAYANGLQAAGYATDPAYAEKIQGVLRGDTMRSALQLLKTGTRVPITKSSGNVSAR